jgi:hypothetical protein
MSIGLVFLHAFGVRLVVGERFGFLGGFLKSGEFISLFRGTDG